MRTCNYIIRSGRTVYRSDRPPERIPAIVCGKPATHVSVPIGRLFLCDEHAAENWGTLPPRKLTDEERRAPEHAVGR